MFNLKLVLMFIMSLITGWLKSIFKPDPDTRYMLTFDDKTGLVSDETGIYLHVFILDAEYELFIECEELIAKIATINSEKHIGKHIFYGFPIKAHKDMKIILTSSIDDGKSWRIY